MKLLLNQEDPASVSRVLTYYDYLNRSRSREIDQLREAIESLQRLEVEIQSAVSALEQLQIDQKQEQETLQTLRAERQTLITSLDQSYQSDDQKLAKLEADRKALEKVPQRFARRPTARGIETATGRFGSAKGQAELAAKRRYRPPLWQQSAWR